MTTEHRPSNFTLEALRADIEAARNVTQNAEIFATRTLRDLLKRDGDLRVSGNDIVNAATTTSQTLGASMGLWTLDRYDSARVEVTSFDSITRVFTYFNRPNNNPTSEGFSIEITDADRRLAIHNLGRSETDPDFVRRLRESDKLTKLQFAIELLSKATPVEQPQLQQPTA